MNFIKKYTEFLLEKKKEKESFEDKIEGDGYYKGISTSTARKKVDQMAKQSQMADDDPDAYKEMPGDTKGKKLLKKSKHTKAFDDLYADEALEEMVTNESVMSELHVMMEEAKNFNQFRKMFYEVFESYSKPFESFILGAVVGSILFMAMSINFNESNFLMMNVCLVLGIYIARKLVKRDT